MSDLNGRNEDWNWNEKRSDWKTYNNSEKKRGRKWEKGGVISWSNQGKITKKYRYFVESYAILDPFTGIARRGGGVLEKAHFWSMGRSLLRELTV